MNRQTPESKIQKELGLEKKPEFEILETICDGVSVEDLFAVDASVLQQS